jgi:hypothetical protein
LSGSMDPGMLSDRSILLWWMFYLGSPEWSQCLPFWTPELPCQTSWLNGVCNLSATPRQFHHISLQQWHRFGQISGSTPKHTYTTSMLILWEKFE